jgi:SAM-dependent methyltransferase
MTITLGDDDFFEPPYCPSCRTRDFRYLDAPSFEPPAIHPCPVGSVRLTDDVMRKRRLRACNTCGIWYHGMIPKRDTISRIYDTSVYAESILPTGRRRSFDRARHALARHGSPERSILDVGASSGAFLKSLTGWTRSALEPTSSSVLQLAFADHIYSGYVDDEDIGLPEQAFGVVTMFDVAEHLYDVSTALETLHTCLKSGGLLLLETGDSGSRTARRAQAGWYYAQYLAHFVFFNERSVSFALRSAGFDLLSFRRVHHQQPSLRDVAGALGKITAYEVVTAGGLYPRAWRLLADRLCAGGVVPRLPWKDHCFVVARKP